MNRIFSDKEVFEQIKEKCRPAYVRTWKSFKDLKPTINFEEGPPGEDCCMDFFRFLRQEKKFAFTTLWTSYSQLNSTMKRKYGVQLQDFPRVTMLLKSYDEDMKKKATIFDETVLKEFLAKKMDNSYWEVRQAISTMAFFGGLRFIECQELQLEKILRGPDGYIVTHMRAKQRTDRTSSKFLVPAAGGFADQLGNYLEKVHSQLGKFQGRVWFTGRKSPVLSSQPMGKNMVTKVPHELAILFNLPEPKTYTFHSFRRTSATSAADAGATTEQMVDFFGWKNGTMCQEYISSSKAAMLGMANKLSRSGEKEKELNVDINSGQEVANILQHTDEAVVLEEDPDLYTMAGIPLDTNTTQDQQSVIESTLKQALSSVTAANGGNISMKVNVVFNNVTGTMNMNL